METEIFITQKRYRHAGRTNRDRSPIKINKQSLKGKIQRGQQMGKTHYTISSRKRPLRLEYLYMVKASNNRSL